MEEIVLKIIEKFNDKKIIFSFEIFPPKPDYPIESIYNTLKELSDLSPDYISVTYGAGGSLSDNRTSEISSLIKNKYNKEALAHLTCIGSSKKEMDHILEDLKDKGIKNILALRGDIPEDGETEGDFSNSQELIRYIRKDSDFGIAAACYPEGHVSEKNVNKEIEILKLKEEVGADYFISQLFFDNNLFYDFLNKVEQKNIKGPIQAGIMPVINKKQIERVVSLSGATIPEKFIKIMNKYEHDKTALRDAGIAYALEQIVDLASSGVQGIHLYTMNNPYIARSITNSIDSILSSINKKV